MFCSALALCKRNEPNTVADSELDLRTVSHDGGSNLRSEKRCGSERKKAVCLDPANEKKKRN